MRMMAFLAVSRERPVQIEFAVVEKNVLRPWLKCQWCFPRPGSEFVWRMEDVLDVYCRPYDEQKPLVCLDEMGKVLVKEKHPSEPAHPGQDRREDYTYEKKGQRNVFIACEPLGGKRYLQVTQRRTKKDWAYFIEELLTVHYPTASKVILVMDNLNTHTPASLYDTFAPDKAKGLLDRLEIHYPPSTPVGSISRRLN
jgi:DDE superfamily endonuclease